jgi:DNA-binding transcriptional MerR regulator
LLSGNGSREPISIGALIDRSGTHRQTIHYYLRKGLLPAPVRPNRTSALYSPHCVDLIHLIKLYQDQLRLSLDEIAAIFHRAGYDAHSLRANLAAAALQPGMNGSGRASRAATAREVAALLDPSPPIDWVESLVPAGLVEPEPHGTELGFSPQSVEAIRQIWEGARLGIPLSHFEKLKALIEDHAQSELEHFKARLREMPLSADFSSPVARAFSVFDHFGSYCRRVALNRRFITAVSQSFGQIIGSNRQRVFPSESFLARIGLNREIDRLLGILDQDPHDMKALKNLARAYHLKSDWVRLRETVEEILRLAPEDEAALAGLGRALRGLGRYAESIAALERALRRSGNPLVKLRLGQTYVNQARESGDAAAYLDASVRKARLAAEAIQESRHSSALSRKIRLNLAIDTIIMAEPLGLQAVSEQELEQLHREFAAIREPASHMGRISLAVARMYAAFALYLVREKQGHKDAARLRDQILKWDPDGILAVRNARRSPKAASKHKAEPPETKKGKRRLR